MPMSQYWIHKNTQAYIVCAQAAVEQHKALQRTKERATEAASAQASLARQVRPRNSL